MNWPKNQPSLERVEMITMLIQEEDMTALIDGCLDIAVSVRKQAMGALTEMLKSFLYALGSEVWKMVSRLVFILVMSVERCTVV